MRFLLVVTTFCCAAVHAATVQLNWVHPVVTVDNLEIPATGEDALKTTVIQWGTCTTNGGFGRYISAKAYDYPIDAAIVSGLEVGTTYCFRAYSKTNSGESSGASNVVSLTPEGYVVPTMGSTRPRPPGSLTVQQLR